MNYTYVSKKLPKSQVELTVTISAENFQPLVNQAFDQISQQTKIDGFRPGKIPADIVKQRVGEMKIYEEAAILAVEKSYLEIATKEKLEPLGSPKIDMEKLAPNNDFIYKATVTLIPEVKIGDYKSIKIAEKEIKTTAEQINKVIADLRNLRATEILENKIIENGDKVEVDFDILRDKVPIDGGAQRKYPLVVGSGHFIPGFEEQLIGLKTGEDKEFNLTFPEQYHNKNLAGKESQFKVKIINVYKRTLPEANDEFAKSMGAENLDTLKQQIEHNLEHEEHHKEEERIEIELINQLIAKSQFGEIPDILINAEVNKMIQEMDSNLSMQGIKLDDYLKHLSKTLEQLKLEFVPQAIKRVQGALLLRAFFFQEKMEISEAEIDQEIEMAGKMYQANPELLKNLKTSEYRDYIRNSLGNNKVMNFLKTACVTHINPEHKH
ncbi:MAG: trigger factor [Candidatus Buchananbacteria bacterium RBG_13_39_9]|uniref:Trigger factor n=1 Tax=Candidatus Buchananbacteria bacterium RBG_13_39_9 TaxID=1797531 RepID=A0A1G1XNB5_9BACT|nr:MAG: trigger factor [Candidatus Buchananbacteria bacterium RBG_13_39_9]